LNRNKIPLSRKIFRSDSEKLPALPGQSPKQLQLLQDLMPNAVGVLADPAFPTTQSVIADLQAAARTLGLPPNPS
jgi:hypothetical protein